jgi:hypothetical protein
MALPITGPISADDINTELVVPPTSTTALNDPPVRTLFARPTINSEISYDHGHGKFTSVFLSYVPPGNPAYGLNLRQMAIDSGWNQNAYVELTIGPSTIISSTSASIPSLTIDGTFPNGAKLINNGTIIGRGGDGGRGGYGDWGNGPSGTAGGAGGVGVNVSTPVIIENNGTMGGGGGGGGGGGSGLNVTYGGGGGGGASYGTGGAYIPGAAWNNSGADGSLYTGGGGGGRIDLGTKKRAHPGGAGGAGGNPGAAGVGGNPGAGGYGGSEAPGAGGAAGVSVNGDRYVTWTALGTKYGSSIS